MKFSSSIFALTAASFLLDSVVAKHPNFANEVIVKRAARHTRSKRASCRASSRANASTDFSSKPSSKSSGKTSSSSKTSGKSSSSSSSNSTRSASDDPFKRKHLSINGISIGFLPDNGDSGGQAQDINELDDYIGIPSFSVGLYAHLQEGVPFDGAELFDLGASKLQGHSGLDPGSVDRSSVVYKKDAVFHQVVKSGAVFIASVMPTSWEGLTADNNTQAVRVAKVMKRFTDAGVVSYLRFAHEANWYNSDSCNEGPNGGKIYPGSPQDVKDAWAVMAAARDKYAPLVKMYWSPNTGPQDQIEQYAPEDVSTIDVVGVDWYPSDPTQDLPSQYQWMHDKYASEKVPFTIGETGHTGSLSDRQTLLKTWTSAETAAKMPHFKTINYFHYVKGSSFLVAGKDCTECDKAQVRSFFQDLADS